MISGELEFSADVTNAASTGLIAGRDAIFNFIGGLTNDGSLGLTFGTSDVLGDVTNTATGNITISGASNGTFYDDLVNDGVVQVSAGSQAVYFGAVSGTGSYPGTGTNFFEGDLQPGASPSETMFGGDVVLGAFSTTQIELAGTMPGSQFDRLAIAGDASIGGTLDVSLIDAFFPTPGDSFEIITFASRSGEFATATGDVGLLDPVTFLLPLYSDTNLLLFTSIPGDGNLDGTVEAGDYTLWANEFGIGDEFTDGDYNGDGTVGPADYTLWANNFGLMASAPALSVEALAEPAAISQVPRTEHNRDAGHWRRRAFLATPFAPFQPAPANVVLRCPGLPAPPGPKRILANEAEAPRETPRPASYSFAGHAFAVLLARGGSDSHLGRERRHPGPTEPSVWPTTGIPTLFPRWPMRRSSTSPTPTRSPSVPITRALVCRSWPERSRSRAIRRRSAAIPTADSDYRFAELRSTSVPPARQSI